MAGQCVLSLRDPTAPHSSASPTLSMLAESWSQASAIPLDGTRLQQPWPSREQLPLRRSTWSTDVLGVHPLRRPAWQLMPLPLPRDWTTSRPVLSSRLFSARAARSGGVDGGSGETVVVVESPSKAATIGKYLGPKYAVLASYGHVRDLASTPGSVQPDQDWAMIWAVPGKAQKCLAAIRKAVRGKELLVLASDPDREGEAIAWHLQETLRESGALGDTKVIRVAFNEITREAVLHALAHPRDVSTPLVEAYLARRALDYVMGYGLSPVLWRKLPGSKSAGRVQSVALRLVTDREHAIRNFQQREYWSVEASVAGVGRETFEAALTHLDGRKLGQFGLTTEQEALDAARRVGAAVLKVAEVKRSKVERSPPPPFTTSTLQQEASAKLYFDAAQTMVLAQKLYEGADIGAGLITYMRTDAVTLSSHAITNIRAMVAERYGAPFLPPAPRMYKSKAKNAQEAHEAIRPTDMAVLPVHLVGKVDPGAVRLYSLIWRRTAASQMTNAVYAQLAVDMDSASKDLRLHAVTSAVQFPGHLAVHSDKDVGARFTQEQVPDEDEVAIAEECVTMKGAGLEQLAVGQAVSVGKVTPEQHFTQPPPRFTEGTLVKALEEAGVGRPSTYAGVMRTLVERAYVRKESRRLVPEMRGLLVSAFLQHYFPRYVDTSFTAGLEAQLDDITTGTRPYKAVLTDFHTDLQAAINATTAVSKQQVEDALEERFGEWVFPTPSTPGADRRQCPVCEQGELELKLSKMGGFLGCSNFPECQARIPLAFGSAADTAAAGGVPMSLGDDPATGLAVTLRTGPYGPYLQLGEGQGKVKPKRTGVPKGLLDGMDLPRALHLLRFPLEVGEHPELGGPVTLKLTKFGPYVQHAYTGAGLPPGADLFAFTLEEAVALLAAKGKPVARPGRKARAESSNSPSKTRSKEDGAEGTAQKQLAKRGRKRAESKESVADAGEAAQPARRKRTAKVKAGEEDGEGAKASSPRRRGRPRKEEDPETSSEGAAEAKKRPRRIRVVQADVETKRQGAQNKAGGEEEGVGKEVAPGKKRRQKEEHAKEPVAGSSSDTDTAARKGRTSKAAGKTAAVGVSRIRRVTVGVGGTEDEVGEGRSLGKARVKKKTGPQSESTTEGDAGAGDTRSPISTAPREAPGSARRLLQHAENPTQKRKGERETPVSKAQNLEEPLGSGRKIPVVEGGSSNQGGISQDERKRVRKKEPPPLRLAWPSRAAKAHGDQGTQGRAMGAQEEPIHVMAAGRQV